MPRNSVILAKAGIQCREGHMQRAGLDSRFHGNDEDRK